MKFVVFLSLWAFASCNPLIRGVFQPANWWEQQGNSQGTNQLWQQERMSLPNQQNSVEQLKQQVTELLQAGQEKITFLQRQGQNPLEQGTPKAIAQQIAQVIIEQVQQTQQILIQKVTERLQQELQKEGQLNTVGFQSVSRQTRQNEINEIIRQVQQFQSLVSGQVSPTQELKQTLEVAIEGQLVSQTIENQERGQFGQITKRPTQTTEVFQVRVQQLVDQITIQDIQKEIARQERNVQQLQQQQQFVNIQRQQIQIQKLVVQQQSQSQQGVQQLELIQQSLQQQEQQLLQRQLVRQVIIQQLQEVLIDQQNQLQEDTLAEQINEQKIQVVNPLFQLDNPQVKYVFQVPQSQRTNFLTRNPELIRGLQMETNSLW